MTTSIFIRWMKHFTSLESDLKEMTPHYSATVPNVSRIVPNQKVEPRTALSFSLDLALRCHPYTGYAREL